MRTVQERLVGSTDEVKNTIDIVWSAYRSVLSKEDQLAYVSTAITSGRRLYEALATEGVSYDELKKRHPKLLFEQIIQPNIEFGIATARGVASRLDEPVVAPAIFEARAQRWSQDEYMAMWLHMIEENVGRMIMTPGWEYSNGGAEEFLLAVQMAFGWKGGRVTITCEDPEGKVINATTGTELIGKALLDLHEMKQKSVTLAEVFTNLHGIAYTDYFVTERNHVRNLAMWTTGYPRYGKEVKRLIELEYPDVRPAGVHTGKEGGGILRKPTGTPEGLILGLEEVDPDEEE